MDSCIRIHNGQYFIGDGLSNLIRGFIMGGASVCCMSKLASIEYASIDMQTCVVVLKRTVSMRGFFRAPQHMLTRRRLKKRKKKKKKMQLKMLFAHVVCYTHLLALLTDNSGGQTMWTRIGLLLH